MRGLLLRLYPAVWRRRYGTEYRDLLDQLPLTPGVGADVARGAAREHLRVVGTWAPAAKSALLVSAMLTLTTVDIAAWHAIAVESDPVGAWRAATLATLLLGLTGALWCRRPGRASSALGTAMIGASLLALSAQYEVGPWPWWRNDGVALLVALVMFVLAVAGAVAVFVRDVRRELRAAPAASR